MLLEYFFRLWPSGSPVNTTTTRYYSAVTKGVQCAKMVYGSNMSHCVWCPAMYKIKVQQGSRVSSLTLLIYGATHVSVEFKH